MDFKSLINKIDSIEKGPQKINESVDLMEKKAVSQAQQKAAGAALSAKRGDTPKSELKAASAEMLDMSEKELKKMAGAKHKGLPKKKTDEALDMNLIKAASEKGMGARKSDPESDRNISKPYGSRSDKAVDDAEEDDDEPTTKKSAKKPAKKTAKESIDTDRFREKFLSLVEAKKKEAAKTVKGKKADEKMDEGQAPTYNVIDGAGKSVGTFRDGAGFMPGPNAKAKGLKAGPTVPNGYKVDYGRDKEKMDEGKKSGKKKPDADNDGVPDWADKKPGEDDNAAKKTAGKKPAGKKGMTAKQAKYFGKKKTVKESNDIDEFFHYGKGGGFDDDDDDISSGEGPEDLLDAVESEIRNPGQRIDNLTDVLNATFGSDKSPEFEKARRIIEKYIELVTTADMDHYDDDDDDRTSPAISAMDHDDIQRHIREYDLTDRLVHAAAMLEKIIAKGESTEMDEFFHYGKGGGFDDDDEEEDEDGMTMADRARRDGRGGDDSDDGSDSRKKNESSLQENSSAMEILGNVPGGREVIQHLHRNMGLARDARFQQTDRISKSDLRNSGDDHVVLVIGKKGGGAIKISWTGNKIVVFNPEDEEVDVLRDVTGSKLFDLLRQKIGNPVNFYVTSSSIKALPGGPKDKLPESQRRSKRVVAESYQPKMSFREMMKLVVESGGQQQIDPLDKALFAWATKVAKNKVGEGMKAEVYAGLVYERMGGRFEMFDVLSENKK